MRKSLPLGRVDIEEVPSPASFHSIIVLGNPALPLLSVPVPFLLFLLSISSFPFAHSSFPVNISFLSRSFFWLGGFQWPDFSIMMITGMKLLSSSLCIRKSRTEWALSVGLAGLLMKSCRERCMQVEGHAPAPSVAGSQASAKEPSTVLSLGGGAGEGMGTTKLDRCGRESWREGVRNKQIPFPILPTFISLPN